MTPREAGAIEFEEPDWREMFEFECMRKPYWPRHLQEIDAFEITFCRWREFHFTPVEVDGEMKRKPAGAQDAMIALAAIGIMPPRSEIKDVPRGDAIEGYQHDDHMWMSIKGEQWRILGIEDRMLCLERGFEDGSTEQTQINLITAKWEKYTEAAVAVLAQMKAAPAKNAK